LLREFYRQSKNYAYWAKHIFPATAEARKERIFRARAALVAELAARHGFSGGTMLEVGAGYGLFCECIAETGTFDRVFGVEPTPDLAAICREKGVNVIESFIEDVVLDEPVDVIASFEVIEHLFDPAAFLVACRTQLRPRGLLIATCPNIAGFETRMLGRHSDTVDHEHLNYFTPTSIVRLASRLGFEPLEVRTPGVLDCDIVRHRLLDPTKEPIEIDPFLREILCSDDAQLRDGLQTFLTRGGLSSNMMFVARRNT
jgi:2-polyprenyl-3-methyl-5-hydroxy-6-metoxy-1,4-benzoquinol methylase